MSERVVRIGRPIPLMGVVCEPHNFQAEKPAVLIFNSGIMHHIGSCRLSVKLARCLAEQGIFSIRFDFSGLGDSESRKGTTVFEEIAVKEAVEVMDYLEQKRGIKQFILFGLCSGADAAYLTAIADKRVVAYSQIDAYVYRTWQFNARYYTERLLKAKSWLTLTKKISQSIVKKVKQVTSNTKYSNKPSIDTPSYTRAFPPKHTVEQQLNELIKRGLYLNVSFTGGEDDYGYDNQYRDCFKKVDFGEQLSLHYFKDATHIVTHPKHQLALIEMLTDWFKTSVEKIELNSTH